MKSILKMEVTRIIINLPEVAARAKNISPCPSGEKYYLVAPICEVLRDVTDRKVRSQPNLFYSCNTGNTELDSTFSADAQRWFNALAEVRKNILKNERLLDSLTDQQRVHWK
ncbi:hypothetical protein AVEN_272639-1 [Araneus ventricosus]|uniref:Uncharacterized protein n=1 Tax=Araneus ventricosus TaxID=182803 RepID=A0A4Y2C4V5_ARAVE|nr:hypothetical protein AVEN_272639-1 [Araneus ventricosus]